MSRLTTTISSRRFWSRRLACNSALELRAKLSQPSPRRRDAHDHGVRSHLTSIPEWGPERMPYGLIEFAIKDPNGYLLSFGQPVE
jgi:hypothetical protein